MRRRGFVVSICAILVLVLALPASTQTKSVVYNGGMESNISGWVAMYGTVAHTTTTTHNGSAGAAQATATSYAGGLSSVYQCMDISSELPTWPESGGVKYLTANGYVKSDGVLGVNLQAMFYSGTGCDTNDPTGLTASAVSSSVDWTLLSLTSAIPITANSVLFFSGASGVPNATYYMDDMAAFSSTATMVQSRGLAARGGLWGVGLLGVMMAGLVLARRRKP